MNLKLPTAAFVHTKHPGAVCFRREGSDVWIVCKSHDHDVGFASGATAVDAWRNAAKSFGYHGDEPDEEPPDMVNHPPHYQSEKGVECIDAIGAAMTVEEFRGYLRGNCLKYLWRAEKKGREEDLKKAAWYLNKLIETPKP